MSTTKYAPITTSDTGVTITIALDKDVSTYNVFQLRLKAPSGAVKEVSCQLNPEDNCQMVLITDANTFDEAGIWIAQPKLTINSPNEVIYGSEFELEILNILQ